MEILKNIKSEDLLMVSFGKSTGEIKKAKIRRYEDIFQLEYIVNNKAFHKNMKSDDVLVQIESLINNDFKECIVYTTKNDINIFRNKKNELKVKYHKPTKSIDSKTHDRQKKMIISDGISAPFLYDLGISDYEGNILDKKSRKFVQINRFLQIIDQSFDKIQFNHIPLRAVDYCCGKGYLAFALQYYFEKIKKIQACITGIDLKEDVIENLNQIAKKYEMDNIKFLYKDISDFNEPLDVALGLHACDIATDIFLSSAVRNNAKLIISVPCCQHQLFSQIENEQLKSLLSYGLQKDRFTEMLTNTLRVLALKSRGYSVDMIEFTAFEHTMKNVLIRAVYTNNIDVQAKKEYDKLKAMYNITKFSGDLI